MWLITCDDRVYESVYVPMYVCASTHRYVYGVRNSVTSVVCQSGPLVLWPRRHQWDCVLCGGASNCGGLPGGARGSSDVFPFGRKPASFHSGFLPTFRSFFIFLLTPHPRSHCNCPLERQLIFVASCVFAQGKNAGFLFAIWQMSKEKDWLHYVFLSAAWMNILCFSSNLEKI